MLCFDCGISGAHVNKMVRPRDKRRGVYKLRGVPALADMLTDTPDPHGFIALETKK